VKKNPEFIFPKHILNQLNDCTLGFLLFYINERGEIVPVPGFDSQLTATALIAFAKNFCEAVEEVENKNMIGMFEVEESSEEENFDDGEEL